MNPIWKKIYEIKRDYKYKDTTRIVKPNIRIYYEVGIFLVVGASVSCLCLKHNILEYEMQYAIDLLASAIVSLLVAYLVDYANADKENKKLIIIRQEMLNDLFRNFEDLWRSFVFIENVKHTWIEWVYLYEEQYLRDQRREKSHIKSRVRIEDDNREYFYLINAKKVGTSFEIPFIDKIDSVIDSFERLQNQRNMLISVLTIPELKVFDQLYCDVKAFKIPNLCRDYNTYFAFMERIKVDIDKIQFYSRYNKVKFGKIHGIAPYINIYE